MVCCQSIDTGLKKDQVEALPPQLIQNPFESRDIVVISRISFKLYVPVTLGFSKGKIAFPVQRYGEYSLIILKDLSRSVSLMNIEIQNEYPGDGIPTQSSLSTDR